MTRSVLSLMVCILTSVLLGIEVETIIVVSVGWLSGSAVTYISGYK